MSKQRLKHIGHGIFLMLISWSSLHAANSFEVKKIIREMMLDAETVDLTHFAAPLFLSHKDLYEIYLKSLNGEGNKAVGNSHLNSILPMMIADIIKDIAYHEFPHGMPDLAEMQILQEIILNITQTTGYAPAKIPDNSYQNYINTGSFKYYKNIKHNWLIWSSSEIAHALTMRLVVLLSGCTWEVIDTYRTHPQLISNIDNIFHQDDKLTNWILFKLLSSKKSDTVQIFEKFIDIMKELYKLKNFHTLKIFSHAISDTKIFPLISSNVSQSKIEEFKEIANILCLANYKDLIKSFDIYTVRMPILNKIFIDLRTVFSKQEKTSKEQIIKYTKIFTKISETKKQSHYRLPTITYIYNYFENLPEISDDVIADFIFIKAYIKEPRAYNIANMQSIENPSDARQFASYLKAKDLDSAVLDLFKARIFTLNFLVNLLDGVAVQDWQAILVKKGLSEYNASGISKLLLSRMR